MDFGSKSSRPSFRPAGPGMRSRLRWRSMFDGPGEGQREGENGVILWIGAAMTQWCSLVGLLVLPRSDVLF
jgi:hypothetical protein